MVDLFQWSQGHSAQFGDGVDVVVFDDDHTINKGDSVKCTGSIADVRRLCSYLRAQGVKTGELVEFSSCLMDMTVNLFD